MRFFNTAGPVNCQKHYCLPPLVRIDLNKIISLIEQEKYFVLHAPRQTGKTSCLLALMDYLNQQGKYRCLYFNVEMGQSAREDVKRGMKAILSELASMADDFLGDRFPEKIRREVLEQHGEDTALNKVLTLWTKQSPKPLILLIDEVDTLIGDTLISLLRQLRTGYPKRPALFPQSIILCGVRDVRDYRIHSDREKAIITGGSAFNVKAESLRLGDFSGKEVETLYDQHTEETGQKFDSEVFDLVWEYTQGQPWLVNALGYEVCFKTEKGRNRKKVITAEMIVQAKENIIQRRETHIDQLVDKLQEKRVQRVVEPMLKGESLNKISVDDLQYVIDLGLVKRTTRGPQPANAIYREIIPRELSFITQLNFESTIDPVWYIQKDGSLDMHKLLSGFQDFFREHSEHWVERFDYKEAGPQLLLQAFLQRIVNGGGRIEREYGLGRMRTDLLVVWMRAAGKEEKWGRKEVQKVVIELKVLYK
ncbi:MAG: ATP-binding protein, partial [Deltaproteobacteria bacterium]|nr:ATP-binding protein [Deltaproteobacteria bacterium]